jgi:hypothetical protein
VSGPIADQEPELRGARLVGAQLNARRLAALLIPTGSMIRIGDGR